MCEQARRACPQIDNLAAGRGHSDRVNAGVGSECQCQLRFCACRCLVTAGEADVAGGEPGRAHEAAGVSLVMPSLVTRAAIHLTRSAVVMLGGMSKMR